MQNNMLQKQIICWNCEGNGAVDSGGQNPDGSWINICCLYCNGSGKINMENEGENDGTNDGC